MFQKISAILFCAACSVTLAFATEPNTTGEEGVLVMKNGQVLRGKLSRVGDRVLLVFPDGELRIKAADVEFQCNTTEEAYYHKREKLLSDRADERLDLADWCLRQGMLGHAAEELSEAMRREPTHPRVVLMERRIEQQRKNAEPAPAKTPAAEEAQATKGDLDRLARAMPQGTMETFTAVIQPVLLNGCAAAGCHGPKPASKFQLERLTNDRSVNRRPTLQNLQTVLDFVNFQEPEKSPLLNVPTHPHGTAKTAIFSNRQGGQYDALVAWVYGVTQPPTEKPATILAPKAALLQTLDEYGFETPSHPATKPTAPSPKRSLTDKKPPQFGVGGVKPASNLENADLARPDAGRAVVPADPFDPEEFNRETNKKK